MTVEHRLIVYGSLAPGQEHADILAPLAGAWTPAWIHGHVDRSGYYAVFHPDPEAPPAPVQLFTSEELPAHWPRLDDFEGPDYRRMLVTAILKDGREIEASVYAAAMD